MVKPQLKRTDDLPAAPFMDEYTPKKYSTREHAATGAKLILVVVLLFGLLWLMNAMTAK